MPEPTLSPEVAVFLRDLLTAQQVAISAPDFLATAQLAATALDQLNEVLKESE